MDDSNQRSAIVDALNNNEPISQFPNLKDSDSECEISITIGEVDKSQFINRRSNQIKTPEPTEPKPVGVDLHTEPLYKNMLIYDLDPTSIDERPWNKPGADITDYFNYGFVEETWNIYRDRQRRIRQEVFWRSIKSSKLQRDVSIMGGENMPGIMVLNSDPAYLGSHMHPESSVPLMNPPTASVVGTPGSMDLSRMQNPQLPAFFHGHSMPPNYFMAQRFGIRGVPPHFPRPMIPSDPNFRIKQEQFIHPVDSKSRNDSQERRETRDRPTKRWGRSSRRSDSNEKERKKRRRRSRSDSRDRMGSRSISKERFRKSRVRR